MSETHWINQLPVDKAVELRDELDSRSAWDLPGAKEIGPARARRAYGLMRILLTTRIEENQPSQ